MRAEDLAAKIKHRAPRIQLRADPFGIAETRWIVEGDVGLCEPALLPYAQDRIDLAARVTRDPAEYKGGLVAATAGGRPVRWRRGKRLDYCVYRPLFHSDDEYQRVVTDMRRATAEWSSICGVTFHYHPDQDTNENLELGDLLFPVIRQPGGDGTLAMAFFPNEEDVQRRILWIFDGYFTSDAFDPVGILRHELGHVLGFRHEHIRPEAPDLFDIESTDDTLDLTAYDPTSVMHYVAAGVGDPKFRFTESDKRGAKLIYGEPDTTFQFYD